MRTNLSNPLASFASVAFSIILFVCLRSDTSLAVTTYTAIDLSPIALLGNNCSSYGAAIFDGQGGGVGAYRASYELNGPYHALIWSRTANSAVDLHPTALLGNNSESEITGLFGSQQVGDGYGDNTGGNYHALLWTGTADSAVDLNPASLLGGNSNSWATGVAAGQQVGTGYGSSTGGSSYTHALLWTGSADSAVDLNPVDLLGANSSSEALGTSETQQVGDGQGANTGGNPHAILWSGTADSAIDLNPAALLGANSKSYATAISGNEIVGYGSGSNTGTMHALLWTGISPDSAIDLNPTALVGVNGGSEIEAASGNVQVGFVTISGSRHATVWFGSAASAIDLSTFLPPDMQRYSMALGVDANGDIIGYAPFYDGLRGEIHAVEWVPVAPEPDALGVAWASSIPLFVKRWRYARS